jgi:DNA-binding response OmpR family regulator
MRRSVRHSLVNQGLKHCQEVDGIEGVCNVLKGGQTDLLVTAPDIEGGDLGRLLQDMRHNRIGDNPFIVVMTLLDSPDPQRVQRVVDTGVDDVLVMPMPPLQIVGRLNNFVIGRKPFVVTHDYVGPDRRSADRPGRASAPLIEVPNPIRWQVVINSDAASLASQIREATARINVHKMKCYSGQIIYLAERIVKAYHFDRRDEIPSNADRLVHISEDLAQRMGGTSFAVGCELVASLHELGTRLARIDRMPRDVEVEILPTLSGAIQRVFDDDPAVASWTDLATVI